MQVGRVALERGPQRPAHRRGSRGRRHAAPSKLRLEVEHLLALLLAEAADGLHLRGGQRHQLALRAHAGAAQRGDDGLRQARRRQGQLGAVGARALRQLYLAALELLAQRLEQRGAHRGRRRVARLAVGAERLLEERGERGLIEVVGVDARPVAGRGRLVVEGMPAREELEEAQRRRVPVGRRVPDVQRGVAIARGADEERVGGQAGQREVDDRQPVVADDQVVGLEVLVRDALLLEVGERAEQVLGEGAQRLARGVRVLDQPARQRHAAYPLHRQREPVGDEARRDVDDADDAAVVELAQRPELGLQRLGGAWLGSRDLQGAGRSAHEVQRRVDGGEAALAEPVADLVVVAEPGAGLEVLGVERARLGARLLALEHAGERGARLGEAREPVGGPQREHPRDDRVVRLRHRRVQVAQPRHPAAEPQQLRGRIEERLAGDEQPEQRAQRELVGERGRVREALRDLGRGPAQPLVVHRRQAHRLVAVELLGEVEAGHPQVGRLGLVLEQDALGPQQPVHDALRVRVLDGLGDAVEDRDAALEPALAGEGAVMALYPGGEGDAAEGLERQADAGLVEEGRIGVEDVRVLADAREDLRLPAAALLDAAALGLVGEGAKGIDAQHALDPGDGVAGEVLAEAVGALEAAHQLPLPDPAHRPGAGIGADEQVVEHLARVLVDRRRLAAARSLGEGARVLQRLDDRAPSVDAAGARRAFDAVIGRVREEDEVLDEAAAGLPALAAQLAGEDLGGLAVEPQRAGDGLGDVPVVVGALDAPAEALHLHDEEAVRRDDDRVELEDDPGSLDEPGVRIDGEVLGQAVDEEADGLPFSVVRRLADGEVLGHRSHQQDGRVGEPGLEGGLGEEAALVRIEADDEVERPAAARGLEPRIEEDGQLARGAALDGDQARERALLPAPAGDGEDVAEVDLGVRLHEVVGELAAGAGDLEDPVVRLDLVEIGLGHARRQAEQLGLGEDVVGRGRGEREGGERVEPGGDERLGERGEPGLGAEEGGGVEARRLGDRGVLEEQLY